MNFNIEPAVPSDAARITEIYFSAFTNELSHRIMPRTDDVREYQLARFKKLAETAPTDSKTHFLKIVGSGSESDQTPVIAGFAIWRFFDGDSASDAKHSKSTVQWPASSDAELCNSFFSRVDQERKNAIGEQPHYYLDMLAVDPAFGRRGLGARLLKWGLDRADGERVITFISSSPTGRGLYEKHGCRALNNYQVIPGYRETSMVRPVSGLSRG
ncbi:hypothetical protein BJX68DRAFT_191657 [Aspergillus pseudodeflectus]|uniref:N-acetyltransferase domain-containing protein n=1 Tax=Aspergillus pseudodeflectus TaxID=176178 RepID=A0ABR4KZV3_9EURO